MQSNFLQGVDSSSIVLAQAVGRKEVKEVVELNAAVEVDVGRIGHNARLGFFIPNRAKAACLRATHRVFQFGQIADAIVVLVCQAIAAADAERIEHIAFTIARSLSNAWTAADSALVEDIALTIALAFRDALSPTHAAFIEDVAGAVALTLWDSVATADAAFIEDVAGAVALAFWDSIAAADATFVEDVAVAVAFAFLDVLALIAVVVGGFFEEIARRLIHAPEIVVKT